jgi:HEAT repeat protein
MEQLLKWSLANSKPEDLVDQAKKDNEPGKKIDTSIIDHILGKDESTQMVEAMQVIAHPDTTLESKEIAFDNLEMLVEHIDNAKNLEPLKLWEPILALLKHDEPVLRKYAAWVCATATQNNPQAQKNFLDHNGLQSIIECLKSEKELEVRKKCIYAISCSIRHHNEALTQFQVLNGFQLLTEIIKDQNENENVKSRVVFLFNSLVVDEPTILSIFKEYEIFDSLISNLKEGYGGEDFVEKTLQFFNTSNGLNEDQKAQLRELIPKFQAQYPEILSASEWTQLTA